MMAIIGKRDSASGFSLIELTIATALFSLGMGSLSLLFLLAVQGTLEARLQTFAVTHANSVSEMVMMTPAARQRFIQPDIGNKLDCNYPNNCTPGQIADSFMESWQGQLESSLPNGGGIICQDSTPFDGTYALPACDGSGNLVVKVLWEEFTADSVDPVSHRVVNRIPLR